MTTRYPRREKRKLETHAAIIKAAMRLFAQRGYDDTTLGDIAEAADLHLQTVYRHFASKGELAAAIDRRFLRQFQESFAKREVDSVQFWRGWVARSSREMIRRGERYRTTVRNLFAVPAVSTTYIETWYQYQEILAAGIAEDIGADNDSPLPLLIASMLVGGFANALRCWLQATEDYPLEERCVEMVDIVVTDFMPVITSRMDGSATH